MSQHPEEKNIPQPMNKTSFIFSIIFLLIFLSGPVSMMIEALKPIEKIEPLPEYENVHIQDNASIFNDTTTVESSLKSFENVTGICPYIITVYDCEWNQKYEGLSIYADYLYNKTFSDDQHFLLVCSIDDNTSTSVPANISFYPIEGDSTRSLLSAGVMEKFKSELSENLQTNSVTTDDAFIKTFDNTPNYLFLFSNRSIATQVVFVIGIVTTLVLVCVCIILIATYISRRKTHT